jgi:hypothetical protein
MKAQKTVTHDVKDRAQSEIIVRLIGTAPMLVGHPLPWDIGPAYWEAQSPEISKSRIKRATASQLALLNAISKNGFDFEIQKYDTVRGLDPYQEAVLRGHWLPDHAPAFPVSGFLAALTTGAVQYGGKNYGLPAKKLRAMQLFGDDKNPVLARIKTATVSFDETMGINSGMNKSPRHIIRLMYDLPWETELRVRYSSALLTSENITQALEWAGDFGVGQRRPSSPHGGQYGTFRLAREED